jgi:exocyst complex component 4
VSILATAAKGATRIVDSVFSLVLTAKYDREVEEIDDVDGSSRPSKPTSRLSHYLDQLSLKPPKDPMLDITDTELASLPAIPVATHRRGGSAHGMNSVAASIGSLNGLGGVTNGDQASGKPLSIEADSFAYMEMLLESLAALAKLNYAVDIVTQRIAGELHSLVEAVIEEVDER